MDGWMDLGLTFSDAVLSRQESLLHQTLQDRPDRRPMNQLQYEQVGLERMTEKCSRWLCRYKDVLWTRKRRQLTQQQAVTVIWTVLRPGWHTCFRYSGLWEVLLSPRSIHNGVALTLTWQKQINKKAGRVRQECQGCEFSCITLFR